MARNYNRTGKNTTRFSFAPELEITLKRIVTLAGILAAVRPRDKVRKNGDGSKTTVATAEENTATLRSTLAELTTLVSEKKEIEEANAKGKLVKRRLDLVDRLVRVEAALAEAQAVKVSTVNVTKAVEKMTPEQKAQLLAMLQSG